MYLPEIASAVPGQDAGTVDFDYGRLFSLLCQMICNVPCPAEKSRQMVARRLGAVCCFLLLASSVPAQYTPEHPKVVQMVEKAVGYLANSTPSMITKGADVLIGYAMLLAQSDVKHPKVVQGAELAKSLIAGLSKSNSQGQEYVVYEIAVSCILLSSLDSDSNRNHLEKARDWLVRVQKDNGGFGYLHGAYLSMGDISQTQYALLALWSLDKAGIAVPASVVERAIRFLLSTQDPSGAWGYQGIVGPNGVRVAQTGVSKSLGTAGICGLLLAADTIKLFGSRGKDVDGIPEAFERVELGQPAKSSQRVTLKRADLDDALQLAFDFQDKSPPEQGNWHYYWRYSQERYESFREVVKGRQEVSPAWYNDAVQVLAYSQSDDGSWRDKESMVGNVVDTAFAVLFLVRSTQRAIGKLEEGLVFGGYELPSDVANIRMMGNRIVSDVETSVESLISLMEGEENRVSEGMLPNDMQLSKEPKSRVSEISRLSRLLNSSNHTARQLAARLLGRSEDVSVAPDLIFALMDPDPFVPQIAEEGLRLISRKLSVVHLKEDPTDEDRARAESFWKEWFLGVKPDYVFLK